MRYNTWIRRARLGRGLVIVAAISGAGLVTSPALGSTARPAAATSIVACGDVYGSHGLVAAINAANAAGTPQTISLAKGCTYTLTKAQAALCCIAGDQDGLPAVTGQVTILGNGGVQGDGATIARERSSAPAFRILEVAPHGKLLLNGLNLQFGDASTGGGVYNAKGGTLLTSAAAIIANHTSRSGGGVGNAGTAVLAGSSRIEGNTIGAFEAGQGAFGGGIENSGVLRVKSSAVSNNKIVALDISDGQAQGAGIHNTARMSLVSSTVSGNSAETDAGTGVASGAGISTASATVQQSTVQSNVASAPGGGSTRAGGVLLNSGHLAVSGGTIDRNTAGGAQGDGGGIFVTAGTVTLQSGATVINNTPDNCDPGIIAGCTG